MKLRFPLGLYLFLSDGTIQGLFSRELFYGTADPCQREWDGGEGRRSMDIRGSHPPPSPGPRRPATRLDLLGRSPPRSHVRAQVHTAPPYPLPPRPPPDNGRRLVGRPRAHLRRLVNPIFLKSFTSFERLFFQLPIVRCFAQSYATGNSG
jgi:hypothetical protein